MSNRTDESTDVSTPDANGSGESDRSTDSTERLRRLRLQTSGSGGRGGTEKPAPVDAETVASEPRSTPVDPDHYRRLRVSRLAPAPAIAPSPRPSAPTPAQPTQDSGPDAPPERDSAAAPIVVEASQNGSADADDGRHQAEADEAEARADQAREAHKAADDHAVQHETEQTEEHGAGSDADEVEVPDLLGAAATVALVKGGSSKRQRAKADRARRKADGDDGEVGPPRSDENHEIVHVFESDHVTRIDLGAYIKELWAKRKFMAALAKSDIKGRRSSTSLGAVWGLLDPLFQSAIYFFVYIVIRGSSGGTGRTTDFLPLLIAGVFLFRLFTSALSDGGKSVKRSTSLMLNASFPRAVLPLASVHKGLIEFVPTLLIYGLLYGFLGVGVQRDQLLLLPLLFGIQIVLSAGVALGAATIVVFFPDFENMLRYIQRMLFFTTPIIFPADRIPEGILPWLRFNPLFGLFNSYQRVLGGGEAVSSDLIVAAIWATGFLILGTWVFLRNERAMAARL